MDKLSYYGVSGNLYKWLKCYLLDRKQRVKINDSFSNFSPVISGVPQGSVIGPLLFLIYINDLPNIIKPPIYASLFADDAKILYSFKPTESCLPLQCALDELSDWMKRWELEIAPTKCVVMRIGNKNPVHSYFINDFELHIHTSFKDLGITFNDNMSFNTHINTICTKAHLIINRLFRCLITNDYIYLLKAYISYVRPIVESDSSVWNPDNFICNSNNIENIQIYFTKILFYRRNLTKRSYEDRIIFFNIKTLFHRRLLADLTLTYKILNGLVDVDATDRSI